MGRPRNRDASTLRRAAIGVLVVLGVAMVVVEIASDDSTPRTSDVARAVAGDNQNSGSVVNEKTALDAGVASATLMARLFPLERVSAIRVAEDLASEAYRSTLAAAIDGELVPLQRQVAGLAGRPVYRQSVLAARVLSFAPPRATVGAWVMLSAGQGAVEGNVMATFATITVDLVFERGSWRLDGTTEMPGPSPQVHDAPSTTDSLVSRLDGYADWRPSP